MKKVKQALDSSNRLNRIRPMTRDDDTPENTPEKTRERLLDAAI